EELLGQVLDLQQRPPGIGQRGTDRTGAVRALIGGGKHLADALGTSALQRRGPLLGFDRLRRAHRLPAFWSTFSSASASAGPAWSSAGSGGCSPVTVRNTSSRLGCPSAKVSTARSASARAVNAAAAPAGSSSRALSAAGSLSRAISRPSTWARTAAASSRLAGSSIRTVSAPEPTWADRKSVGAG